LRALANLLDNAQRHGHGVTLLRVAPGAGSVAFEVEDSGPGFAPGDEVKAFQPFYRSASSLGLGLSLVQRIARAHGGTAQARNRAQGGAVVSLTLPRG
jgi:signal transduction histidine kinase